MLTTRLYTMFTYSSSSFKYQIGISDFVFEMIHDQLSEFGIESIKNVPVKTFCQIFSIL